MTAHLLGEFEQQVLLAVWRLGDGAYGTSIRNELEARTGTGVAQGAVYTTLLRLEKKGMIASRRSDPTPVRGGKAKRLFAITPDGMASVQAARRLMDRLWEGLPEPATDRAGRERHAPRTA
jgi:DNA-binding PadR family transcriptional regulator